MGSVVTVGTFDGVHRGHRAVLDEVNRRAVTAGRTSVLVTFEPHPLAVVNPAAAPSRLTTAEERLEALATSELDRVVVLKFDREMASLSPEAFVDSVLRPQLDMRELVIGYDHGFGRGRSGDVSTLLDLGRERGFSVDVVGAVGDSRAISVSSTSIRRSIAGGDLAGAARLLGRNYSVSAVVGRGAARGRTLGFPTLNLAIPSHKLLPPDGVWAVVAETPAGSFGGMMNQGHRPTFDDGQRLIEVNLFGFNGDLYDRSVRVEWLAPLRGIRKFAGVPELQQQLVIDAQHARAVVASLRPDLDAPLTAPE
jgi:riboflavin kinase/FMN adenylyltransferase